MLAIQLNSVEELGGEIVIKVLNNKLILLHFAIAWSADFVKNLYLYS